MKILVTGNTTFKIANFREGLVKRLLDEGHEVTVIAPKDEYSAIVQGWGCKFVPLKMQRNGVNPVSEILLFLSVLKKVWSESPDFIFSYTIKNNIYFGLASRALNKAFVPNVTGLGPAFNNDGMLNGIVRNLYRLAFGKARTVFFQNPVDLAVFRNAGLIDDNCALLLPGSGVNLAKFSYVPMHKNRKEIIFLLVARLLWDKGVGLYVDAARDIQRRFPNVKFQILGPLDLDSKSGIAKEHIDSWVREGVVDYLGSTQNVSRYLTDADCVVLPSYYHEGTPRSLLEAGALGRPIITTNQPGCRDTVVDGQTGYIVAPKNIEALIDACERFVELHPDSKSAMGLASNRHISNGFSEDLVIDAYLAALASD